MKNRERQIAKAKAWNQANPERRREISRAWDRKHPDKAQARRQKRAERLAAAEGSHTQEEWHGKLSEFNYRCAYCGCQLDRTNLCKDHVVPISKGGSNWIFNIVPACRSCNSRKRDKDAEEFRQTLSERA